MKKVVEEAEEGRNPTGRRRDANRAEAREEYELERMLSCCNGDCRRRAKLDVSSRKPLANLHRAIALGAMPRIGRVFGAGDVLFSLQLLLLLLLLSRTEKVKAKR